MTNDLYHYHHQQQHTDTRYFLFCRQAGISSGKASLIQQFNSLSGIHHKAIVCRHRRRRLTSVALDFLFSHFKIFF